VISLNPDSFDVTITSCSDSVTLPLTIYNTGSDTLFYNADFGTALASSYCAATSSTCDEFISRVQLNTIDNLSGCLNYTDFSGISTSILPGTGYPMTVTNGPPTYGGDQCGIWIDWNQDLDFADPGENLLVAGTPGNGPYTTTVTSPPGASYGSTIMRIRIKWTGAVPACGTESWGEVEDYTIVLTPGISLFNAIDTIPPGDSAIVNVKFNSTGLSAGTYNIDINVNSNDPANPLVLAPIVFTVTGTPSLDVSASCLDLDTVMVGGSNTDTVDIINNGCDTLFVTSITTATAEFIPDQGTMTVLPFDSEQLIITFTPSSATTFLDTISISTNDFDTTICLVGVGIPPATISLNPDSFNVTIASCDDSITMSMTVYNTGGSPLIFNIDASGAPMAPQCTPDTNVFPALLMGIYNVTFNTINNSSGDGDEGYMDFTGSSSTLLQPGQAYILSVTTGPDYDEDVRTWIDFNNNGIFEGTELVFTSLGIRTNHAGVVNIPQSAVRGVPLRMRVGADYEFSANFTPCTTTLDYGQFEDYTVVITSTIPVTDTVATGDSSIVNIQFRSTGLISGQYISTLLVNSNDPVTPQYQVPYYLTVAGPPSIDVTGACLDYDTVQQFSVTTDTLTIANLGCDTLFVTNITKTLSEYSIDTNIITVFPYDTGYIYVTFSPLDSGLFQDTLNISNNDVDTTVCLTGYARLAPIISHAPASLSSTITGCCDSITYPLTIYNTGGGDLTIDVLDGTSTTIFYDGFESGDIATWIDEGGAYTKQVTTTAPANGSFAAELVSGVAGHVDGISHTFTPTQAPSISFYMKSSSTSQYGGFVVIGDNPISATTGIIYMYMTNAGGWYLNTGILGATYVADQWYLIELRNIDYSTQTYDFYIDGVLWAGAEPFRDLADTLVNEFHYYNWTSTDVANLDDVTIGAPPMYWFTTDIGQDTIPPGDSVIVTVEFNSCNDVAGTYNSAIIINSNDPVTPIDSVPVSFTLIGNPVISVPGTCLDFDTIMQFTSAQDTFTVTNTGCDTLFVTGMSNALAEYTVDTSIFTILPGASQDVIVTFAPLDSGLFRDTINIFNNDVDTTICLTAYARLAPVITHNPDSLSATITGCCDSITYPLTIYNTGGGDLTIDVLDGVSTSIFYDGFESGNIATWVDEGGAYTKQVTSTAPANGAFAAELVNGVAGHVDGISHTFTPSQAPSISFYMKSSSTSQYGGFVVIGDNPATATDGIIYMYMTNAGGWYLNTGFLGATYVADQWYFVELRNINYTTQTYDFYIDGFLWAGAEPFRDLADTLVNEFHYYNWTSTDVANLDDVTIGAPPMFWFTTDIGQDTIPPGDSVIVTVEFNSCNEVAGTYNSAIVINSNDPVTPVDSIPVTFTLIGNPVIALSDSCLDFDTIMEFTTAQDSFTVYNLGCDTLFLIDANNALSEYTLSDTSDVILPGDSAIIIVTFAPLNSGTYLDTITLFNNDTNLKVCLVGEVTESPIISTNPDSFNVTINSCCDSLTLPLTVYNTGGVDLIIDIIDGVNNNIFYDGFESGNIATWTDEGGAYTKQVTSTAPANGAFAAELVNGVAGHVDGISHTFTPSKAPSISFYMKSSSTSQYGGFVVIGDNPATSTDGIIYMYMTNAGGWYLNTGFLGATYVADQWYFVELRNIDYTAQTYDFYIDGFLWAGAEPFRDPADTLVNEFHYYNWSSTDVANLDDVTIGAPPQFWFTANPLQDTIVPGDSSIINIEFNSCNELSGVYTSDIIINSNDPLNPIDSVPVTLNINGSPQIALSDSCLNFDTIMEFTTAQDSFIIYNIGCDTLFITDANNTLSEYTLSDTSGVILPGDSATVIVTFAPLNSGTYEDTITIFNNDTNITVCLVGEALESPTISFSPDSFDVTVVGCCDSTTAPLKIYNTGAANLTWSLTVGTILQDDFDPGIDSSIWNSLEGSAANTSCGSMSGNSLHFASSSGNRAATSISLNASSGGTVDFCMYIGTGGSPCENADSGDDVELQYSIDGGASWVAFGFYDDAFWDASPFWACFSESIPPAAQTTNTMFRWIQPSYSFCIGCDNWAIDDVVISTSGPCNSFLCIVPDTGTTVPSDSSAVTLEFNTCGNSAGVYNVDILVSSNDPLNPIDTIPVTFTVDGLPEISFSDTCLYLDSIMEFTTSQDSFMIYNIGCDTLFITDANNLLAEYTLSDTSGFLLPGDSTNIIVTFAPTSAGFYQDTITILNNDVDTTICLYAYAYPMPTISTNPDTFDVTITSCCDSVTLPLTVYNTGGSDLIFTPSFGVGGGGAKLIYSESFANGISYCPGTPQFDNWVSYRGQLDTNLYKFTSVTIRGSNDVIGRTCTDTVMVMQMAGSLNNSVTGTWVGCDGNTWAVGMGCGGGCGAPAAQIVEFTASGATCSCTNPGYTIRPAIGNDNWGGINGLTCAAPTQTLIVEFEYISWLSISPITTDTIVAADSAILNVKFKSCDVNAGTYTNSIVLTSNDPLNNPDTVPITFTVIGDPQITLSDSCLYLDSIMEFSTSQDSFMIYNIGCDTLFITDANNSLAEYTLSDTSGIILPGDSANVIVTFAPTSVGFFEDTIMIFNNDTNIEVCLSGYGYGRPIISTVPDSFDVYLTGCCDSVIVPMTIYNTGLSDLYWNANASNTISDDFDPGIDLSMWTTIESGTANTDCGSMAGNALHFDSNAGNRAATSIGLNTSNGGSVDFCMYIGTGGAPCENADATDDVELQYSIDGGASWVAFGFYDDAFWDASPFWACFSESIPPAAQTTNTMFRWIQPSYSLCFDCDNWAIDSVSITYSSDVISFVPAIDTTLPTDSSLVNVIFNGCNLNTGTYTDSIFINSNDPLNPQIILPVTITKDTLPATPSASDTAICFGDPTPTFTAIGDTGTNGDTIFWYSDAALTILVDTGDTFTPGDVAVGSYTYYLTYMLDSCESLADSATLTINGAPIAPTAADTGSCFGDPVPPLVATGGTNIIWYDDGALTNQVFIGDTFATGDVAVGAYTYYAVDSVAGCSPGPSDTATLTISSLPVPPVASDTAICEGDSVPSLIAVGTNIRWYDDAALTSLVFTGDTFASGDSIAGVYTYYATQTPGACQSLADTVVLTINSTALPTASDTSSCFGDPTPDLTATGTSIQWYSDSALTSLVFTGTPFATGETAVAVYTYYVTQTDAGTGCESNGLQVDLTIFAIPAAPVAIDTSSCFGDSVPDLSAVGSNLNWYSDPGLTTLVFSGNPFATGNVAVGVYPYYVTQTVGGCEGPADTSELTIIALPTAPVASDTSACVGDTIPSLIATGTTIRWYDDPALTVFLFAGDTLVTGQTVAGTYDYYVTQNPSGCESLADTVILTIDSTGLPTASGDSSCFGSPTPDLTAVGVSIQWYSDSALTTLVFTGTPFATGETAIGTYTYYVTQTDASTGCESVGLMVELTINPIPTSPTASDTSICFGAPTPDLTAVGASIQWYSDPALTTLVFTGSPFATGETAVGVYTYYVTQTTGGCEGPADTVTLSINGAPPAPPSSDPTICFGSPTPDLSATGTNIKWYDDVALTSLVFVGNPYASGDVAVGTYTYYATDSVAGCNGPATTVVLTINAQPIVPVVADTSICFSSPTPDLIHDGDNVQWYDDAALTNLVFSGDTFTSGDVAVGVYLYYVTDSTTACSESISDTVTLTINAIPGMPTTSDTAICDGDSVPKLVASGTSIQWYSDIPLTVLEFSGDSFVSGDIAVGSYDYYVTQTVAGCEGPADTATLTINGIPGLPTTSDTAICEGDPTPDLVASGSNIQWYSDPALTVLEFSGDSFASGDTAAGIYDYYVTQTVTGCEGPADTATLTINAIPAAPVVSSDSTICFGDANPGFVAAGTAIQWYSDSTLTTLIFTGDTLVPTDTIDSAYTYYATQTITNCESPAAAVNFTILPIPPAPTASDESICSGDPVPDLTATGTNVKWYADSLLDTLLFSGSPFATGETTVGSYDYYVNDSLNACGPGLTTVVTLTIDTLPGAPTASDTTICFGDPSPALTASGSNVQWYADSLLDTLLFTGSPFTPSDTAIGSHTYYVTDSLGGCGQGGAGVVTLYINAIPASPTTSDTTICFGEPTPDLSASGTNIKWYSDSLLDTLLFSGNPFTTGETAAGTYDYYVTDSVAECESPAVTSTLTITALPLAPSVSDTTICVGTPTPELIASGTNIQWYDTSMTVVFTGDSFASGDTTPGVYTYYVTDSANGCEGPADTVALTIDDTPGMVISDTCLDFGSVIETTSSSDTLFFSNDGCDTLFITSITNVLSEYALDTNNLFVLPGDTGQVVITFTPLSAGLYLDTLNISSNDGNAAVCLTGTGLGAPVVGSNPDTFNLSFTGCCDSTTVQLEIDNSGLSNLVYSLSSDSSWISFDIVNDTVAPTDTSVVNITVNSCNLNPGTYVNNVYINSNDPANSVDTVVINVTKDSLPTPPVGVDGAACFGDPIPDLSASTTGDSIIWYSDDTLTTQVFVGDTFATGETATGIYTYYITTMKDGCEGLADSATLSISTPPGTPTVGDTTQCYGYPTPVLVATGTILQWFDTSMTNVHTGDSFASGDTAVGSYTYLVNDSTPGCAAGALDSAVITIISTPAAPVGSADTTICFGDSVPSLSAIGVNLIWYDDSALSNVVFNGDTFATGETAADVYTYFVTQTDTATNGCESFPDTIVLTINAVPSTPTVSDTTICVGNPTPVLIASGGNTVQWYDDSLNLVFTGDSFATGETLAGTYVYYITDSVQACTASAQDTATLIINAASSTPTAADTTVCYGTAGVLTTSGSFIQWYDDSALTNFVSTGDTFITADTAVDIYTYFLTDSTAGCPASAADTVTLTISATPAAPVSSDTAICIGTPNPGLTATGVVLNWYDDALLGNLVFTGDTFTPDDSTVGTHDYYVTQIDTAVNSCESEATTVLFTINSIPTAPISSDTSACEGSTIPDLTASGSNIQWYSDTALSVLEFSGDTFTTGNSAADTYLYYVTQTVSGCESPADTVTLVINPTPPAPTASNDTACEGGVIPSLNASGTNVNWYSDPLLINLVFSGNKFATGETTAGTYDYYVTDSLGNCVGPVTQVTLVINAPPGAPVGVSDTICEGDTVKPLTASGTNLQWYSDPTLLLLVGTGSSYTPKQSSTGTYAYYVTQTVAGCPESPADTVYLVVNPTPLVTLDDYNLFMVPGDSVQMNAFNALTYSWSPATGLNTTTGASVVASPASSTKYTVTGTNSYGCSSDTSAWVYVDDGTAIDEITFIENLKIYPNPTRGNFIVEFETSQKEPFEIRILNAIGEVTLVKQAKASNGVYHESFNMVQMASGIYYLQIISESGIVNKKIVILQGVRGNQ